MKDALPLFYFPSTICWVDDDPIFLEAIQLCLNKNNGCLSFHDVLKALDFFRSYRSPLSDFSLLRECSDSDLFDVQGHYPVDINIATIKKLLEVSNKSNEIAALFVDYNMPHMNGLEFFRQIGNFSGKKILLTGGTDYSEVIEAFNVGLIDKFIVKDANISDALKNVINELTYQFFIQKTCAILSHLEVARQSPLSDSVFVNFFNVWRNQNHIKEFYLINKQGGLLVKDHHDKEFYFIVMSEFDKNEFVKLYNEIFEAPLSFLSDMMRGEMIPFFGLNKEPWQFAAHEWRAHFFPAQIIQGREKYYWTVVR